MANFCRQCSIRIFGEDFKELAELFPKEDADKGFISGVVICEGCGPIQVNYAGECVSSDCMRNGHTRS